MWCAGRLNMHSARHMLLLLHPSATGVPVAAACAETAIPQTKVSSTCTNNSLPTATPPPHTHPTTQSLSVLCFNCNCRACSKPREACLSWKDDMKTSTNHVHAHRLWAAVQMITPLRQRLRRRLRVGVQPEDGLRERSRAHTLDTSDLILH